MSTFFIWNGVWQGISLTRNLDSSQRADMRAYMSLGIEDSHPLSTVLRIRDIYAGSRIWIFSITDAGYLIRGKVPYLKVFLTYKIVTKLSEIWFGMFFPDPRSGSGFLSPIPDPGVKKHRILDDSQYCWKNSLHIFATWRRVNPINQFRCRLFSKNNIGFHCCRYFPRAKLYSTR